MPRSRTEPTCWVVACVVAAASLLLGPVAASRAGVKVEKKEQDNTKTLEWTVDPECRQGAWELKAWARAECGHGTDVDNDPLTDSGTWHLPDGLPLETWWAWAFVDHAEAQVDCEISASAPPVGAGPQPITLTNAVYGFAEATECVVDDKPRMSKGEGYGSVRAGLGTAGARPVAIAAYTYKLSLKLNAKVQSGGKCTGYATPGLTRKKCKVKDPISITLVEVETGLEHEEVLFDLAYTGDTGRSDHEVMCDWEDGILLATEKTPDPVLPIDGFVEIVGSADSSWLVTPYGEFSARLDQGTFTATGAWAGAPWVLTYDGDDVVSAYLGPEYVPQVLDYVIPDSYFTPGMTYEQGLNNDEEAELCASCIPEPATALLVGLGALALIRRKRK